MSADVIVLYADSEQPSHRFIVHTEERRENGWVTLVRLVPCPNRCVGGEVWSGDLYECHVCGGNSHVALGVGGAYLHRSWSVPIPEEPTLEMFANELTHYLPPEAGAVDADGEPSNATAERLHRHDCPLCHGTGLRGSAHGDDAEACSMCDGKGR